MQTNQCSNQCLATPPRLTMYGLPPESKRQCLSYATHSNISFAGHLPSQLLETTQNLQRMLDVLDSASPEQLQALPPRAGKHLQQLSVRLSNTAKRLCPSTITGNSPTHASPREPKVRKEHGYTATDKGVVDGIGVVAQSRFRPGDSIAQFSGPVLFRIKNPSGRYNVFSIITTDPVPQLQFRDRDTYTAWSDIHLLHSGSPGIEIGRDGDSDIRYLNHSKNANVQVVSTFTGRMNIHECHDKLLLNVKALKHIKPGDELVFDYDKRKPDSAINFSLTTVELPDDDRADKIHALIIRIFQDSNPFLPPLRSDPRKCLNQPVIIPEDVDMFINEIMILCANIHEEKHRPAMLDELLSRLDTSQRILLGLIISDAEPDLERIETLARYLAEINASNDQSKSRGSTDQLTIEHVQQSKKFLQNSFFNEKQTWIKFDLLKERLHRKTV